MVRNRRPFSLHSVTAWTLVVLVVVGSIGWISVGRAETNPPLPVALGSRFVGNLSAPSLNAGASGSLGLTLSDPLAGPIHAVALSLQLYAFNSFPGNANSTLPSGSLPFLTTPSSSGPWANYSFSSIGSGGRLPISVGVVTASGTPAGAYSVRTSLSFVASNGTAYRLASRGWFSTALWENATEEPNGSAVLDQHSLQVLNISGILPETSFQVTSSALSIALYVLLGVALVLVGIGAYVYFVRSAHSNSGAR